MSVSEFRGVAQISQMRGLLLERGVAIVESASIAQRTIPEIINNPRIDITDLTRDIIGTLHAFLLQINEKIRYFDKQIEAVFRENDVCQRIAKIRGERRGYNRAAVAVANKNAREIWALLQHGDEYRANP